MVQLPRKPLSESPWQTPAVPAGSKALDASLLEHIGLVPLSCLHRT